MSPLSASENHGFAQFSPARFPYTHILQARVTSWLFSCALFFRRGSKVKVMESVYSPVRSHSDWIPGKDREQPVLLFVSKNLPQIFAASERKPVFIRAVSKRGRTECFCKRKTCNISKAIKSQGRRINRLKLLYCESKCRASWDSLDVYYRKKPRNLK